jgi:hypothetical protein
MIAAIFERTRIIRGRGNYAADIKWLRAPSLNDAPASIAR